MRTDHIQRAQLDIDVPPAVAGTARQRRQPVTRHYDLTVRHAHEQWHQIRWALFVFPDITDVAPTDDAEVVRIFHEGSRAYPNVWRVELLQAGFDVPAPDTSRPSGPRVAPVSSVSPAAAKRRGPLTLHSTPHQQPHPHPR